MGELVVSVANVARPLTPSLALMGTWSTCLPDILWVSDNVSLYIWFPLLQDLIFTAPLGHVACATHQLLSPI